MGGHPSGNGSSVRVVNERVERRDVAPEQSGVRREDPEIGGGGGGEANRGDANGGR